jgi:hypothetical protein
MKTLPLIAAALFLCLLIGCGGRSSPEFAAKGDAKRMPANGPAGGAQQEPADTKAAAGEFVALQEQVDKDQSKGGADVPKQGKTARKIKHVAELKLITDEFDTTRDALQQLIDKHQGYEAMADVRSSPGTQRLGTWRVRVPIEQFSAFRDAVRKLAEIESDTINTEDLTDQYYDLDAHIKNLKAEQESWREMLKKTNDKLDSFITVKRELDRVTDDIQRKEGRLRLMANLTELTTVNLTLRERQKFTPDTGPQIAEAATFSMKADRTFGNSWGVLVGFGQAVALVAIALAPWLPVILVVSIPVWYSWRQWRRHAHANVAVPVTPATSA